MKRSQEAEMLKPGDMAPQFEAVDIHGNRVSSETFRNKKNVLIYFSRYIGCSWCQMFVIDVLKNRKRLEALETVVILISESPENVLKKYSPPQDFIIAISDPEKKLYGLFGVKRQGKVFAWQTFKRSMEFIRYIPRYRFLKGGMKGDSLQAPAVFLLDRDGCVRFAHLSPDIASHPDVEDVIKVISHVNLLN